MYTFLAGNMPEMWKPFGVADFLMMLGFIWSYQKLDSKEAIPS